MHRSLVSAVLPLLFGSPAGHALRLLDGDAHPVARAPRLAADLRTTALSPDARRFAALGRRRIVVIDRRTRRRVGALRARPQEFAIAWPSRNRLVTLGAGADDANVVRVLKVRTGRTRVRRFPGPTYQFGSDGRRVWLVFYRAGYYGVARFDGGRFRGVTRIRPPAGVDVAASSIAVHGDLALLEYQRDGAVAHELVRVSDGSRHAIALPGSGGYRWLTRDLLASADHVVQLDRARASVTRSVSVEQDQTLTPYRRGFVVGLGRARYGPDLTLLAENPAADPAEGLVYAAHGRLYARTTDCTTGARGITIADADTGAVVERRDGAFALGKVGALSIDRPNEEDCD
jgi:hypothetical protein